MNAPYSRGCIAVNVTDSQVSDTFVVTFYSEVCEHFRVVFLLKLLPAAVDPNAAEASECAAFMRFPSISEPS